MSGIRRNISHISKEVNMPGLPKNDRCGGCLVWTERFSALETIFEHKQKIARLAAFSCRCRSVRVELHLGKEDWCGVWWLSTRIGNLQIIVWLPSICIDRTVAGSRKKSLQLACTSNYALAKDVYLMRCRTRNEQCCLLQIAHDESMMVWKGHSSPFKASHIS